MYSACIHYSVSGKEFCEFNFWSTFLKFETIKNIISISSYIDSLIERWN